MSFRETFVLSRMIARQGMYATRQFMLKRGYTIKHIAEALAMYLKVESYKQGYRA